MKVIIIDAACFTSKSAAHEYIAESLDFPEYYGKNLDALADLLSELPRNVAIVMSNTDNARTLMGNYADGIAETFRDILGGKCRFTEI